MKYAAANPGLFGAAGAFSGAVDTDLQWPSYPTLSEALWLATDAPGDGPDGHCTWGDPFTQRVVWEDNDPTYLAPNLKGTALFLASGNGLPGPFDPTPAGRGNPGTDTLQHRRGRRRRPRRGRDLADEQGVREGARQAGSRTPTTSTATGTHAWPYWQRDLQHFLAWLDPYIGHPPPQPRTFSYRSARASFSAWGWSFAVTRSGPRVRLPRRRRAGPA